MMEQYGPVLIFLGVVFLFYGIVNLFIVGWHRFRYKVVIATITSCRKYKLKLSRNKMICHALVMDFTVDNKQYKVRQDVSIEEWAYSEKKPPYIVGQQMKIYYKSKNPQAVDLDPSKFYRRSYILLFVFSCMGLISLPIGIYLTYYYT